MAAAIVTKKRGIRLAHLVAGTRSFNINMPKEINRLVIDALSDYLFTAGVRSTGIATREQSENSQRLPLHGWCPQHGHRHPRTVREFPDLYGG